jgi:glucosamine--fructose-6-phosphate aminotransferase (isomerizing)
VALFFDVVDVKEDFSMCGIVGYVGQRPVTDILINGLRRLEYRGYDSAGLAFFTSYGAMRVIKQAGKVALLEQKLIETTTGPEREGAHLGIAHTRWATHGLPTEANAHPHTARSGEIALVHNGIIENYAAIRKQLESRGCVFSSQTDTEALAHLIGAYYNGDLLAAVSQALKMVEGTYGIAVISVKHQDQIVVARKGSPLVIGVGEHETIVASDVSAIVSHTRQVVYLQDGDIALITQSGPQIFTLDNSTVHRPVATIEWEIGAAEKGGYEHFMLKEIFEQPMALQNAIRGRLDTSLGTAFLSGLNMTPRELATVQRLIIVACGTSLHAGMVGKYLFEGLATLPTDP